MAFFRFNRDKRGYEHFYLVESVTNRRGKSRPRVLYWYRTPPNIRVGRAPFDEHVQRALEAQNPNVTFDWRKIIDAPIPSADVEKWRERRRTERAEKAARRGSPTIDEPADDIADRGSPIADLESPMSTLESASPGDLTPALESMPAATTSIPTPTPTVSTPTRTPTPTPILGRGDSIRKRRRRRRGRGQRPDSPGAPASSTPAAATPGPAAPSAPAESIDVPNPTDTPGD